MSGVKIRISDDDLSMIQSLVHSPVFHALKRLIDQHVKTEEGMLLNSDEHKDMLRIQGRIQGLKLIEALPALIVAKADQKAAEAEVEQKPMEKILEAQKKDYDAFKASMAAKRLSMRSSG